MSENKETLVRERVNAINKAVIEIIEILSKNKIKIKDVDICFNTVKSEIYDQEVPENIKVRSHDSRNLQ